MKLNKAINIFKMYSVEFSFRTMLKIHKHVVFHFIIYLHLLYKKILFELYY